jgi:hypothetical protein
MMNVNGVAESPDITLCFQLLMASAHTSIQKIDPIVNSNTPLRSPVLGSRLMP